MIIRQLCKLLLVLVFLPPCAALAETRSAVTTTGMIGDLVREIGGERVDVTVLMGPGVDPHLFKPTQGDFRRLSDADIIFHNGLKLEGKMSDVLNSLSKRKPVYEVTAQIPRDKLLGSPTYADSYDPHVWFDVDLWRLAAKEVERRLSEFDPEGKDGFQQRAAALDNELVLLDAWISDEIEKIPSEQRVLITAHDAFSYFGKAYGIEVMGLQGISTESEYGLQDLKRLVDVIKSRKVKAVFVESSVPKRFIESLQQAVKEDGADVAIGGELFSDAMGTAGTEEGTYLGMVRHNVRTIVSGLK